ncbi:MAG TPA: hypothetical protein VM451_02540 [Candidatus Limnocylindria bacterium]|nr:hypothetical protein [Candidatus Limnocylindria bacterium]
MTAIVLPNIDKATVEDLMKRIPDVREIDLSALKKLDLKKIDVPRLENAGKSADDAIDRLLGRSRAPVWPWVAAGIGLVAIVGAAAAFLTWLRRPTFDSSEPWTTPSATPEESTPFTDVQSDLGEPGHGLTAAETSLTSSYPNEEA